jgi:hypothetical protein
MTRQTAIQKDVRRDNLKISKISALSRAETHALCLRMTMGDLMKLALSSQDYCMGTAPAEVFQELEQQMIKKYKRI